MRENLGRIGLVAAVPLLVGLGVAGAMAFGSEGADAEEPSPVQQQQSPEGEKDGCPGEHGGSDASANSEV
jgi:hypothetical protein